MKWPRRGITLNHKIQAQIVKRSVTCYDLKLTEMRLIKITKKKIKI